MPGGGSVEDGAPVRFFGSHCERGFTFSRYLQDHINAVAYEAGDFVRQLGIGDGVDQGTG
jgi:hypothetical protein